MDRRNYKPGKYVPENAANMDLGPCMKALNPRQQSLVWYLIDTGTDNWTEAVTQAGYEGTYESLRVTASRLRRDPKVGLAIAEVGRSRPNFDLPLALKTIRTIAADPSHKDAGKMALALAGMSGVSPITRSESQTTVTHTLDPLLAMEQKLALLPPETADLLRSQLLPRTMIDVTPNSRDTLVDSDSRGGDVEGGLTDVTPRDDSGSSRADDIGSLGELGDELSDDEADKLMAGLL